MSTDEAPSADVADDDYVSRTGNKDEPVPVQADDDVVDEPSVQGDQNADEQLARDDTEAIDSSNIIEERTRGAKPEGGYTEPGDDEGLPSDT